MAAAKGSIFSVGLLNLEPIRSFYSEDVLFIEESTPGKDNSKLILTLSNMAISEVEDMAISRKSTVKEVVEFLESKGIGEIKQTLEGDPLSSPCLLHFLAIEL